MVHHASTAPYAEERAHEQIFSQPILLSSNSTIAKGLVSVTIRETVDVHIGFEIPFFVEHQGR